MPCTAYQELRAITRIRNIRPPLSTPLRDLPRQELNWLLQSAQLREIDGAARREYCDWQFFERVRTEGLGMLLPDIQGFRQFGTLLACRARLQIADGDYEAALRSLQSGLMLGKHVSDAPTFINTLVGASISAVMLKQVEEFIQTSGAPNLYWGLTELPQPYVDLRKPLQGERLFLQAEIPALKEMKTSPLGLEQIGHVRNQLRRILQMTEKASPPDWQTELAGLAQIIKAYPEAKQTLIAKGKTPEEVEALPVFQVVFVDSLHRYEELRDEFFKWVSLPYWQARPGLEQARARAAAAKADSGGLGLQELIPAVDKVLRSAARVDRRIAALRCVEAIRMYAAGHDGRLPSSLSEITQVPVPNDPMTGKPFEYRQEGNKAILAADPAGDSQDLRVAVRYELTIHR